MHVVSALLRFFSLLYHGLFALALFVLGALIIIAGGAQSTRLEMLPWSGSTAVYVLLIGGLFGLAAVVLALLKKFRLLFLLWAAAVTFYLVRGYFLGGYKFTPNEFTNVVYLVVASFVALLGAFLQTFAGRKR